MYMFVSTGENFTRSCALSDGAASVPVESRQEQVVLHLAADEEVTPAPRPGEHVIPAPPPGEDMTPDPPPGARTRDLMPKHSWTVSVTD